MALAFASSPIGARAASVCGTASLGQLAAGSTLAADDQHQKLTHTERAYSWGMCAPIPAVVADNVRACELGRGDASPVLSLPQIGGSSHCRRPVRFFSSRRTGHHLPVSAIVRAPGLFIHALLRGSSPFAAQSVSDEPLKQFALSDLFQQTNRLSKCSPRPGHHVRSEKGWRYQISVMRCPK